MRRLPLFIALYLFTGCSNWALKQQCEQTNWFEYARDLASGGRYLDEDGFVGECKKVDKSSAVQLDLGFKSGRERYCTYENFLRLGETGELAHFKMCDGLSLYDMQKNYATGLSKFCVAKVGYEYGSSGKVYKNVCLKKDEAQFLPTYYRGRKQHLERKEIQIRNQIVELRQEEGSLARQIEMMNSEIEKLPNLHDCHYTSVYNESTKQSESMYVCTESYLISSLRSNLYSKISPMRDAYMENSNLQKRELKNLDEVQIELTKIPANINSEK